MKRRGTGYKDNRIRMQPVCLKSLIVSARNVNKVFAAFILSETEFQRVHPVKSKRNDLDLIFVLNP